MTAMETDHPSRFREQGHARTRSPFNRIASQPAIPFLFLLKVPGTDLPISFFSTTISCLNQTVSFCVPIKHRTQSQLLKTHGPSEGFFFFFLKDVQCSNRGTEKLKAQNELPDESIYQLSDSLTTNPKDTMDLNSVALSDATATE